MRLIRLGGGGERHEMQDVGMKAAGLLVGLSKAVTADWWLFSGSQRFDTELSLIAAVARPAR